MLLLLEDDPSTVTKWVGPGIVVWEKTIGGSVVRTVAGLGEIEDGSAEVVGDTDADGDDKATEEEEDSMVLDELGPAVGRMGDSMGDRTPPSCLLLKLFRL